MDASTPIKPTPAKKQVLMLAPQPFFTNRGTPINVRCLVESLVGLGYEVDLLVLPMGESLELPGVKIIRSPRLPGVNSIPIGPSWQKILLDVPFLFHALGLVIKKRYFVIHGIEEGGIVAALVALLSRTPYVFDMDSSMPEQLEASGFLRSPLLLKLFRAIENFSMRRALAILTVCAALSEKARQIASDVPIHQIEDIPLESSTVIDERLLARWRKEWGLSGKRILLYTGNLESYQGIDLLLAGFRAFLQEGDSLRKRQETLLLFVGGKTSDIEKYQAEAKRMGITEAVFFAGPRPNEEMGSVMALADLLVSSRSEGTNTPLKIYSYMATGKPILATAIFSHTQVLNEQNSFLFEPNPASLAAVLEQAFADSPTSQALRAAKAQAAKELVETKYCRSEFKRRLGELYNSISSS